MSFDMSKVVIDLKNIYTSIKGKPLHKNLEFQVQRGEIIGIVGTSGGGKSVLLRTILGLMRPDRGSVTVLDKNVYQEQSSQSLRHRWGVMFQSGALFSSLSVGDNIRIPLCEIAHIPLNIARELTFSKLAMVGLSPDTETKFPAELSGGMIKRVALARALALDAEIIFLDEPTSGLDPIGVRQFDELILKLRQNLNLTVVMITHDLDSLFTICDRVAVLVDQHLIMDTPHALAHHSHPWIKEYFSTRRPSQEKA